MVDIALITTVLAVTLGGIALVVLGAIAYIANEAVQNRLDDKAGVPRPGTPSAAPDATAPTASTTPTVPAASPRDPVGHTA
ncbi:hypothetical protein [Nocardiopsis suaedae]|uniref:Uncharacterized protein n=1 Tax=Nocardiopsis suaedae TaxID=3018444 RepID=A0ABT4TTS3_9ACTN|nr:hypothetical protein [Nocardiopsis suaedae]MDA2808096.1 hypothetical protein [Nocardiopsis suaedae]